MTRTRTIALALAAAALASTLAGGYFMARRVGLHNETSGRRLYGFINIGDRVRVSTEDGSYVERVNK